MNILDGKKLSDKMILEVKESVDEIKIKDGRVPKLAVIMVGKNEASKIYIKNKSKACNICNIEYEEYLLDEDTTQEKLEELIDKLNQDDLVSAILLQSPIPKDLDINKAFKKINPLKDVDGFNPENIGLLQIGEPRFIPCTPKGIVKLLEEYNVELEGKNILILGRSNIVGKPLLQYMLNKNATVTIAHSKTKNIKQLAKDADIIVSSVGKKKLITKDMVKNDVILVDVGINRDKQTNKVVGDMDFENLKDKAKYITPVPGGVGPMTIAMLMKNILKAYELNKKEKKTYEQLREIENFEKF